LGRIDMASSRTYRTAVRSSDEFADIPAMVEFTVDQETAQEIIRLAGIVKANDLHKVEKFDCRACYLKDDPEQDAEGATHAGDPNEVHTEADRLHVSDTEFWFSGYIKHTDIEIESEQQRIDDLAKHLGLETVLIV
jgi:hypothetical protein